MPAEKLTPWDAPKPGELAAAAERKRQKAKLDAEFKKNMRLLGMDEFGNPLPKKSKPEKPTKWWQFIKKWRKKYKGKLWVETPLLYAWLLLLAIPQIPGLTEGDFISLIAIGFLGGIAITNFFYRQAMNSQERWHKMELEMQEHDIKFKMGMQQYAAKRPNQPAKRSRV